MDPNKVITYSLLAHINNNQTLSKGLLDLFVPLVKRALSVLNSEGIKSGKNISEIKTKVDSLHSLNFPLPVLNRILQKICKEINQDEYVKFILYKDGSYAMSDFNFIDYESIIDDKKEEIEELEKLFDGFCKINNVPKNEYHSVFEFIERNKYSISKYLGEEIPEKSPTQPNFLIEAQFVDYFRKIPEVYKTIRNIYLGSIISTYVEFKTEELRNDIELVFDTNFIIGLLDLNTPESSHTCNQLIEIAKHMGFKLSILDITISEVQNLLNARAENFDKAFLQRRINPEDIYNACERRNLSKSDLQRFSDNIESYLNDKGILKISNTTTYRNQARFSKEYESLRKVRFSEFAALHDATATHYVRAKRSKRIYAFEEVNCWFVHNSIRTETWFSESAESTNKIQPESIKVDDLLNIFWLCNPGFSSSISESELTDFGLNALISCTLNDELPKARIIRELDTNIAKYVDDESLKEQDIIRIATRISNRELVAIEEINQLASKAPEEFIKRIKQESNKQKLAEEQRAKKFEKMLRSFKIQSERLKKESDLLNRKQQAIDRTIAEAKHKVQQSESEQDNLMGALNKEKAKRLLVENQNRKEHRKVFYKNKLAKWRSKSWIELGMWVAAMLAGVLIILSRNEWSINKALLLFQEPSFKIIASAILSIVGLIFSGITIRTLFSKYRNHSNISAYKDSLEIPESMTELKSIDELS